MSLFEIRRKTPGNNISRTYPNAAKRGLPLGAHASDVNASAIGTGATAGGSFLGFLTRDVQVGGPTLDQRIFPLLELPFTAGGEVSLEKAEEIECEGSDYIVTTALATGVIDGTVAIGTQLSLNAAGLWYVKQATDKALGVLTGNSAVGSSTLVSEAGGIRIRVEVYRVA